MDEERQAAIQRGRELMSRKGRGRGGPTPSRDRGGDSSGGSSAPNTSAGGEEPAGEPHAPAAPRLSDMSRFFQAALQQPAGARVPAADPQVA